METQMVKPCEICGSNSCSELILTCCKCRMVRQHVYCIRNFAGKKPEIWICGECTSGEGITSPKHGGKEAFQSEILKGSSSCTVTEQKILDARKGDPLLVLPKLLCYQPYLPALDVTWRGCFKFFGGAAPDSLFGFYEAHPASRVHHSAYEISKNMDILLEIQLLPQCYALVDLFHDDFPEIHDIALYFFPSSKFKGSEENIRSLVERLEMEKSVIRSLVAGVELLILSPKLLHGDSQDFLSRACTRPFLLGVFYNPKSNKFRERHAAEPSPTVSPTQCSESTDMEIDMLGGQTCGRIDVVVSKASSSSSHGEPDKESSS